MYLTTLDKKECCGCTACASACPKQCISMTQDEEGFYFPVVDKDVCIECGLCEKVCPFENPKYENTKINDVYASYVKDINQRRKSTSGGIFFVVAKWVIEQGGVVYGAAFDDKFKLNHIGVDNLDDLKRLRGSKYLQSFLGNTYKEIKDHLKQGRWVYFTGVGCQVAGLNAYLRKKYKTLITSDLVCHGAPSQLMFDWHLDYLRRKEKANIKSYEFRQLDGWGVCESYEYDSSNVLKKRTHPSYFKSPYLYSFMQAYDYRYSCYDCKFAKIPRQGDITLADYWGVSQYFPELDRTKGVSLILLNSEQGVFVWNKIKDLLVYRKSTIKNAASQNANLVRKTIMPDIRPYCYEIIKTRGYDDVAKKEFHIKGNWKLRFKVLILDSSLIRYLRILLKNKL